MRSDIIFAENINDLVTANELMIKHGRGFLPIVSPEGTLQSVVFKKDLDHHLHHPFANVDSDKRLIVGAAVSTHPHHRKRIEALVREQVDFLLIDASDGFTSYQQQTIAYIKANHDIPVIAGNVVSKEGFDFLVDAGADAVKVGICLLYTSDAADE